MADSDLLRSDVFNRTQTDAVPLKDAVYNAVIGLVLCWGFGVNYAIVKVVPPEAPLALGLWPFLIAYFASCFYGVYLFNSSKDPLVSFAGYNFVVVPFGLVVNAAVHRYDPNLVLTAMQVTAGVTATMMAFGTLFPAFFRRIHTALAVSLLAVILVELFQTFVLHIEQAWTDWAVAVVFCGYIGYDWGRANQIPKTMDNAVDSAAAIYMDIINLFLRILRILGRKRD